VISVPLTKSAKGYAELADHHFGLDFKARQLLILADGQRCLSDLQHLRPNIDAIGMGTRLISEGFLIATDGRHLVIPQATPHQAPPPPAIDQDQLEKARTLMLESINTHLGILGAALRNKAHTAQNATEIVGCIAQWHMALRDSRHGRPFADQYLQEIRQLLHINADSRPLP
jgi:hypothetical protein